HGVSRRLRRRELRAQAPAQRRRARDRARPRIPRADDDRGPRRAAARGSARARLGRQGLDDVLPLAGRARRRRDPHEETGDLTMADTLSAILESKEADRLATGFVFTEGPLWHPDGFYYFVDIRRSNLHKLTPGKEPELVRSNTGEGNGTTFDLQGRLVICEGGNRRVTRWTGGQSEILMDRFEGKRLNRPNDVVCKSDGSIYFTDPGLRVPLAERELASAGVYRIAPDGKMARGSASSALRKSRRTARSAAPTSGPCSSPPARPSKPCASRCRAGRTPGTVSARRNDRSPELMTINFGTFLLMQSPSARSSQEIYTRGLEIAQAAEALGFGNVWLAEHHFSTYGYLSRPAQLATYIAAKTT